MTRLPDTLRTELADAVERILAPDVDLQALAREMDDATGAIRTRPWIRAQPTGLDQMIEVNRTLLPVTDHEPDLALLTAGEGSPVYMRRWWLRREVDRRRPRQERPVPARLRERRLRGIPQPPVAIGLPAAGAAAPSSRTPRHGTTVIENRSVVLRPAPCTGTGSGSARDRYCTTDPWDGSRQ